jgi:methylmalonyl-CoA mutase C-terminal domain/subunit
VLLGGIVPNADRPTLEAMGVSGIFGPGMSTSEIVDAIRRAVDEREKPRVGLP